MRNQEEGGGPLPSGPFLVGKARGRITIGRAAEAYREKLARGGASPDTLRFLRNLESAFLRASGLQASSPLVSVTPQVAEQTLRRFRARYAPGTAWGYATKLLRLFRVFVAEGWLLENPFGRILPPHKPRPLPVQALSRDEVKRLLGTPKLDLPSGLRHRAMLELFYATGLRLSELCRLEVGDVDFSKGTVSVRGGKGSKDRVVPLGETAARWLRRYLDRVRPRYARGSRALWVGQAGRPVAPDWVHASVRRLGRKAGIARLVSPHMLRRTCATHLLAGGASAWVVKEILGHADVKTLALYLKTTPQELKNVHEKTHPRGGR